VRDQCRELAILFLQSPPSPADELPSCPKAKKITVDSEAGDLALGDGPDLFIK